MTGLDPEVHVILEIACVITDPFLEKIIEGPHLVIHYPNSILEKADSWSLNQHTKSGLLSKSQDSNISLNKAEEIVLDFLKDHVKPKASPLCGNSVWQDRRFLIKHMPKLEAYFHYRNIDVSSIKELVNRWYPGIQKFQKNKSHSAMEDIYESIKELRYYKDNVFIKPF